MISKAVRFSCQRCGACCHSQEPGDTVVLYDDDVRAAANALGLRPSDFVAKYANVYEYVLLMGEERNSVKRLVLPCEGGCALLNGGLCSIHAQKPFQCRAWPFIEPTITSDEAFSVISNFCPGHMTGSSISPSEIRGWVRTHRMNESAYFSQLESSTSDMHHWVFAQKPCRRFRIELAVDRTVLSSREIHPKT